VITTRSYHPRAMDPVRLQKLAHRFGRSAKVVEKIEDALPEALRIAGENAMVLVTGSLFTAAGARFTWLNHIA